MRLLCKVSHKQLFGMLNFGGKGLMKIVPEVLGAHHSCCPSSSLIYIVGIHLYSRYCVVLFKNFRLDSPFCIV